MVIMYQKGRFLVKNQLVKQDVYDIFTLKDTKSLQILMQNWE